MWQTAATDPVTGYRHLRVGADARLGRRRRDGPQGRLCHAERLGRLLRDSLERARSYAIARNAVCFGFERVYNMVSMGIFRSSRLVRRGELGILELTFPLSQARSRPRVTLSPKVSSVSGLHCRTSVPSLRTMVRLWGK